MTLRLMAKATVVEPGTAASGSEPGTTRQSTRLLLPRVRSHCRFRNRGTEYVSESGMKLMSGRTKRQCMRPGPTVAPVCEGLLAYAEARVVLDHHEGAARPGVAMGRLESCSLDGA